jgi:hypothetical protein
MIAEPKILLRPDMAAGALQGSFRSASLGRRPWQLGSILVHRLRLAEFRMKLARLKSTYIRIIPAPECPGTWNTNFGLTYASQTKLRSR